MFEGRTGYLEVASKASIRSIIVAEIALDVSPAIPMDGLNSVTIGALVYQLDAGIGFSLGLEESNDTENWSLTLARVGFTEPGFNVLTLTNIAFRYIRLRYSTSDTGGAAFTSGVWRWKS